MSHSGTVYISISRGFGLNCIRKEMGFPHDKWEHLHRRAPAWRRGILSLGSLKRHCKAHSCRPYLTSTLRPRFWSFHVRPVRYMPRNWQLNKNPPGTLLITKESIGLHTERDKLAIKFRKVIFYSLRHYFLKEVVISCRHYNGSTEGSLRHLTFSVMENCYFSYASCISLLNACIHGIANLPLPFSII